MGVGSNFAPALRQFARPGFVLLCLSGRVRVCHPTWASVVQLKAD